jgi:tetratricopeptide (TPR) repeat protein
MSSETSPTRLEPASSAPGLSSTWFFIKITCGVIVGLGVLVVALSPQLYTGINKDSPEYYEKKAKEYVQQKNYQKAIEAYNSVLEYEPDRREIFARADHQIKSLQQLQSQREAGGAEESPTAGTGSTTAEDQTETEEPAEEESTGTEDNEEAEEETTEEEEDGEGGVSPLDESLIP